MLPLKKTFNVCCTQKYLLLLNDLEETRKYSKQKNYECSRTPLIRTLVIRIANYPGRLGPSGTFVENSTKLTCLEVTGYRIEYNVMAGVKLGR